MHCKKIWLHCKLCTGTIFASDLHKPWPPHRNNQSLVAAKFWAQLWRSSLIAHSTCEDKAGLGERAYSIIFFIHTGTNAKEGGGLLSGHILPHTLLRASHIGKWTRTPYSTGCPLTKKKTARSQHLLVLACIAVSNRFVKKEGTIRSALDEHVPIQPRVYASHTDMCDHSISAKAVFERDQKRQNDVGL